MNQPENQDLYSILNLPRNASQSQIKTAYRKLALKYHPDRQSSPEEKRKCTEIFTKIGNAYEVLGDPARRKTYDRYGIIEGDENGAGSYRSTDAASSRGADFHDPFMGNGFFFGRRDPFQDPFFTQGSRGRGGHGGFMDPFDLFQNFFGDEFSHEFHNEDYLPGSKNRQQQRMNSNHRNDRGAFGPMGFGGGFGDFMGMGFGRHMDAMNSMMNQLHQQHQQQAQQGFSSTSYSSSSSSYGGSGGGGGGVRESISTSTRIINGKRQTITERVRVNPDGTVERHTETSGDDDFPSTQYLGYQNGNSNAMEGHTQNRYLPESNRTGHASSHRKKDEGEATVVEEDAGTTSRKRRFFRRKSPPRGNKNDDDA